MNWWNDPNSLVCYWLKKLALAVACGLVLHFGYESGFIASKDIPAILMFLAAQMGLEKVLPS